VQHLGKTIKICTYNVNSIRARIDLITKWLEKRANDLDVLCLQEIKTVEKKFPYQDLFKFGFNCEVYGQKGFNGIAICSKIPLEEVKKGFGNDYWDQQKRIITGKILNLKIINAYAPHGGLKGEEKYFYKLKWFNMFLDFLRNNYSLKENIMVLGDFNCAIEDKDVYAPNILSDSIGTMIEERKLFKRILNWGLTDTLRYLNPEQQQFTWWNYIGGAIWRNEGMRIGQK
jgi:exodeoxyribonuclease-3